MAIIDLKDGDSLEAVLKKFKRMVQRENILREYKQHAYFLRPGERDRVKRSIAQKRRQKRGRPRFSATTAPPPRRVSRRTELPPIAYEDSPTSIAPPPPPASASAESPIESGNGASLRNDAAMGAVETA